MVLVRRSLVSFLTVLFLIFSVGSWPVSVSAQSGGSNYGEDVYNSSSQTYGCVEDGTCPESGDGNLTDTGQNTLMAAGSALLIMAAAVGVIVVYRRSHKKP